MSVIHWGKDVLLGNSRATAHVTTHDSGNLLLSFGAAARMTTVTHLSPSEARKLAAELVIGADAYEAHEASALAALESKP